MRAAILAVGSELLGTDRLDTNSLRLTEELRRFGVELVAKSVIGDAVEEIAGELGRLLSRADLVLVTGGLGPTADDVTREAVARALDRPLRSDPAVLADIESKFARFRRRMPEVNRRQAEVIAGAEVLENRRGTAPGMRIEDRGRFVFLFPGVPHELEGLIFRALVPWLRERTDGAQLETAILRVACLPESAVEEKIQPLYAEFGREAISVLASNGDIQVRVGARGPGEERRRQLRAMRERVAELLGGAVYGEGAELTLESVVGELLGARRLTVATAESCTGGLVAERLTRVPGSSAWFLGGVVSYADRLKLELLGVGEAALGAHGAVSREVAREMAAGARSRLGADFGIALSGIAGPGGGSPVKPVGTVHLALAGPAADELRHRELHLPGDRGRIRWLASQWALELLRRRLVELPAPAAERPEGEPAASPGERA